MGQRTGAVIASPSIVAASTPAAWRVGLHSQANPGRASRRYLRNGVDITSYNRDIFATPRKGPGRGYDRTVSPFGRIEPAAEFGPRATDPLAPRCALPTARQRMIAP